MSYCTWRLVGGVVARATRLGYGMVPLGLDSKARAYTQAGSEGSKSVRGLGVVSGTCHSVRVLLELQRGTVLYCERENEGILVHRRRRHSTTRTAFAARVIAS
jgi:hypothetical protein